MQVKFTSVASELHIKKRFKTLPLKKKKKKENNFNYQNTFLAQSAVKLIRENTADVNVWNFTPSFSMLKKILQRVLRWGAPGAEVPSVGNPVIQDILF